MIGRKREQRELNQLYGSGRAELVAIYGRRRVGKTYLVDETFSGRISFRHAGLAPTDDDPKGMLAAQLEIFYNSLILAGATPSNVPHGWLEAFLMLEQFLQADDDGTRQLVFLDELPWMDTPRSGFLRAFEGFWNNWGCHRRNLMVIVCGSASSWVEDRLINNHGGLYGRVTREIRLAPFTLRECEELFDGMGVRLSRYDIAQAYMIFGGIPYYLGYFDGSLSLAQNVDATLFARRAPLADEFDRLFASLFTNPGAMQAIVRFLGTRSSGYTRHEIANGAGVSEGGGLSHSLRALIASDFVVKYVPFGSSAREQRYRLVDPFCLFCLHFLDKGASNDDHFWQNNLTSQSVVVWRGLAFENVCFAHVDQIKAALGVSGVSTTSSAWARRADESGPGTQIDLLLSRKDNVLNMCEIKYVGGLFSVSRAYYETILGRQELLSSLVSPKVVVRSTLVTTFGLSRNEYAGAFTNVVTLDDLFAS